MKKNVQNLKNSVKGILWFRDKIPDKKPEDPTELLALKIYFTTTADNAVDKFIVRPIEKYLIKGGKGLTMTSARDTIIGKIDFGDVLPLPDGYGKEEFMIAKF